MKQKEIQFLSEYLNHVYYRFVSNLSTEEDDNLQEEHMFNDALKILNKEVNSNETKD